MTTDFTPKQVERCVNPTSPEQMMVSLSTAFSSIANLHDVSVPSDYLQYSIQAVKHLKDSGRSNVLYSLAQSLATLHSDETELKLSIERMPMGMLEYTIRFADLARGKKSHKHVTALVTYTLPLHRLQSVHLTTVSG